MNGGYVYVVEFGNGMVKVGHSQAIAQRLQTHRQIARSFGLTVNRCWESPCHDGWRQNEEALKQLARELGGTPTTPEYFNGVSFDALVDKARELPFPEPAPAVAKASTPQAAAYDDDDIRQATLREHVEGELVRAGLAFDLLDRGMTPAFARKCIPELADQMEFLLGAEAKVRKRIGQPPAQRPVLGRST